MPSTCGNITEFQKFGLWRRLVARLVRDEEVGSSNLPNPTNELRSSSTGVSANADHATQLTRVRELDANPVPEIVSRGLRWCLFSSSTDPLRYRPTSCVLNSPPLTSVRQP